MDLYKKYSKQFYFHMAKDIRVKQYCCVQTGNTVRQLVRAERYMETEQIVILLTFGIQKVEIPLK